MKQQVGYEWRVHSSLLHFDAASLVLYSYLSLAFQSRIQFVISFFFFFYLRLAHVFWLFLIPVFIPWDLQLRAATLCCCCHCVCVCVCSAVITTHRHAKTEGSIPLLQLWLFDLPSRKDGTHPNRKWSLTARSVSVCVRSLCFLCVLVSLSCLRWWSSLWNVELHA